MVQFSGGRSQRLKAKSEILPDLQLRELNNNGMELRWNDRRYRIWKADAGEIPPPGHSHTKANYLSQNPVLFDFSNLVHWNLVILWDFDKSGVPVFRLAFPEELNGRWGNPSTAWNEELSLDFRELAEEADAPPADDGDLDIDHDLDVDHAAEGE